ncbi:glycosyltransferas involved in cell wall bioproteinsis [Candidatus Moduliflexus flocculans]|uniref:Glycosyltransferas involved in cell wall bioproteinsis n=1 Tax=Candidatus Moduliflexus flocculans TaxID=1499966 RepID=A0A081BSA3_9BACT|nr:glycosyltransferas involved in cell wall bioproteinsis [Candidatus Moduliflexus flocculans]
MNISAPPDYFAYWNAQDYAETPRRIRALLLWMNTACNRQCPECAASIPGIRVPEQYLLSYVRHAAEYMYGIEHLSLTGGEPTLHPHFRELVPQLKTWFGCRSLTLETNGYHLDKYQDLLSYFDDILLSHYPDNAAITEQFAALNIDGRPAGPTVHVTTARRARRPSPCRRANFVLYAYGRLYPCACIPNGYEGIGIPLTANWREEIVNVPWPCADCCFAEETDEPSLIVPPISLANVFPANDATISPEVRPAWRWPHLHDDIRIYGLDLDSWMGREAQIRINPRQSMNRLLMHFESAAPPECHPLTLTFLNQRGETVTTQRVEQAGVTVVQLELPDFFQRLGDSWMTVRCDPTFSDAGRELGIRMCSLRYLAQQTLPLYEEHLRMIQDYTHELAIQERELAEKEAVIQAQHQDLIAKEAMIQQFIAARQSLFRFCDVYYLRPCLKRLLPISQQARLRQWRRHVQPKLGVLRQYPPRPLHIPASYRATPVASNTALSLVSIVTPSLNHGQFLERTLNSVFEQHYPVVEYLVQDGGSTDDTMQILARYQARLAHLESCQDCGQADAINRGFHHATGAIMAWLNSDDLLLPGTIASVVNFFLEHPEIDVVYGHRIIIDEQDQEIGRWILPPHDDEMLRWADYIPQETLFWRRRIWEKSGGYIGV